MDVSNCFMDNLDTIIGTHGTLLVRPNDFPITPLHLLLTALEHRERLVLDDLLSALGFANSFASGYFVYHNRRGSGATRPEHLHFQAVLRENPLPIETTSRQEIFRLRDTVVARLADYPAYGLSVKGATAADVAFKILSDLLPVTPLNLVICPGEVIIVPRSLEQPSGFDTLFGGLEMAGCVVMVNDDTYNQLKYENVWEALSECGWSIKDGEALELRLREAF